MSRFWRRYAAGAALCAASIAALALYKPSPDRCIPIQGDGKCQPELGEMDPLSKNFDPACGYCGDNKKQKWENARQCPADFHCGNGRLDTNLTFAIINRQPEGYAFSVITKSESCDPYSIGYCQADCKGQEPEMRAPQKTASACPSTMSSVDLDGRHFCIDKWECHLEDSTGTPYPYYKKPPEQHNLKAVSQKGVFPQVQMSFETAKLACENAGKRLCSDKEWTKACKGSSPDPYPWGGQVERPGKCNYLKKEVFERRFGKWLDGPPVHVFGRCQHGQRVSFDRDKIGPDGTLYLNGNPVDLSEYPLCPKKEMDYIWNHSTKLFLDERLAQIHLGMEKTGSYPECTSEYQVYDMIGSVNEVVGTRKNERKPEYVEGQPKGNALFRGGFYLDTRLNRHGCDYTTSVHTIDYEDYSIGFRCCRD